MASSKCRRGDKKIVGKRRKVILFQITEALAPNRFKDCWRD